MLIALLHAVTGKIMGGRNCQLTHFVTKIKINMLLKWLLYSFNVLYFMGISAILFNIFIIYSMKHETGECMLGK